MRVSIGENDIVSYAEHLASVISGTAKSEGWSSTKNIVYRCPMHLLPVLDSMAEVAVKTRTAMITMLLRAGIEAVRDNLDVETIEKLTIAEAKAWASMSPEDDGTESL